MLEKRTKFGKTCWKNGQNSTKRVGKTDKIRQNVLEKRTKFGKTCWKNGQSTAYNMLKEQTVS